ncbi:MAG: hypothetical protein GXY52_10230 [Chloroflexi bacterium]|nr:hypothetical protein [Chloroflexota bacterium]
MYVESITAERESLVFKLKEAACGAPWVQELVPTVSCVPAAQLSLAQAQAGAQPGVVMIPRYEGERDRLTSRFVVWSADGRDRACGVAYVSAFGADAHRSTVPYQEQPSKKGTHAHGPDAKALGVCHATMNVNLPELFSPIPGDDIEEYRYNGRVYYIRSVTARSYDKAISAYAADGTTLTLILLNSPSRFGGQNNALLNSLTQHPSYDAEGFISAFNMRSADGVEYYAAYCDYLANRYMRDDNAHGRVAGFIISNEVNSQWAWGNAGEMPVEQYVAEYTVALRIAWQIVQHYRASGRAYISLDHLFNISNDLAKPLRWYKGREVLELLAANGEAEGDFGWDVAYHPYPENLVYPDFWNDRSTSFDFLTPRITFKNIEVLPAYLGQPRFLYQGKLRKIIFSEQGLNSYDKRTEELGFAAYCLAYKKIAQQPAIESFIYHAYADNKFEFGLNLGLRRGSDTPGQLGEAKPAWHAMAAMGTEREAEALERARAMIGAEVWDALVNPKVITGERDTAKEEEFGFQTGN